MTSTSLKVRKVYRRMRWPATAALPQMPSSLPSHLSCRLTGKAPVFGRSRTKAWIRACPSTKGVLHFTIPVKDLDRSEKFYTEVLDFKKIDRRGPIVFMRAGDNHFNLTYSENPITLNAVGRHEIHSAFRLTPQEYDEALKVLPSRGVEIFKQEDRRAGVFIGRSAYVRDPDGNVIELIDLVSAAT